MDNSSKNQQAPWGVITLIIIIIAAAVIWQFTDDKEPVVKPEVIATPEAVITQQPVEVDSTLIQPTTTPTPVAIATATPLPKIDLPTLDESDSFVQTKLQKLTWRKELLKLLVNDDMIRRFVVFSDNFNRGYVAYEHSSFVQPITRFSANDKFTEDGHDYFRWDPNSSKRFSLYVDLIRSLDTDTLVYLYQVTKPLIDNAYQELGYDNDFTEVLNGVISRILDMEIPKESIILTRESVMYKYKDPSLEALDDADKLLLRLGKDNLLVIKSVLLDVNEKLVKTAQ